MRYAPGYTGTTAPGPAKNPNDPRLGDTRPSRPEPSGPMTPVRGGGMLPKSSAVISKRLINRSRKSTR